MNEEWRPVVGWDDRYEVSNLGRVRSLSRWVGHRAGPRWVNGAPLTLTIAGSGYPVVKLNDRGRKSVRPVHVLVAEAFLGPRPPGTEVCHGTGPRADVSVTNLRWDVHAENMADIVRDGTHPAAGRTHCSLGHELVDANLERAPLRRTPAVRSCLACARARSRANYARRTGRHLDRKAVAHRYYEEILAAA